MALLIASLSTGFCTHLYIIGPLMKKLKAEKPGSFAANFPLLVPTTCFVLSSIFFPVMMMIIISDNMSKIFHDSLEGSLGEE